jgi:hypothetical protein
MLGGELWWGMDSPTVAVELMRFPCRIARPKGTPGASKAVENAAGSAGT